MDNQQPRPTTAPISPERVVVMLGLLAVAVLLLFPPWDVKDTTSQGAAMSPTYLPVGHRPIWWKPPGTVSGLGVQVALDRLLGEIGAVVALAIVGTLAAGLVRRWKQADPREDP